MSLLAKQQRFSHALGHLLVFANVKGYGITVADAYAGGRYGHRVNSNHYLRLAIDLNLFVDGFYITRSNHEAWEVLHKYWESLGGAPMIVGDANHFSFEHKGRR